MKIQLTKDVPSLGRSGDIVEVREAYARNFLLPQKLALPATAAVIAAHQRSVERQAQVRRQAAADLDLAVAKLDGATLHLSGRASPQGKLFAALKVDAIKRALEEQCQVTLPAMRCEPETLKMLGTHQLSVELGERHRFTCTVVVDHAET